jgi:hypothetical protein
VGPFNQKDLILNYEKDLPPLSLKFTLQEVESVIDLLKGDFIGQVESTLKNLLNGKI